MIGFLLIGLGNDGDRYLGTRHNVGFAVIDAVAHEYCAPSFSSKFKGRVAAIKIAQHEILLLKPSTYMNLSGESVVAAASFYKIPADNIIVIHDDIDLDCGRLKLKIGGGHGGHNGLKSVDQYIGTDYWRLRIGISRHERQEVSDYVLSPFTKEQKDIIESVIAGIVKNVPILLSEQKEQFIQSIKGN